MTCAVGWQRGLMQSFAKAPRPKKRRRFESFSNRHFNMKKDYFLFLDDFRNPNDVYWVRLPIKPYLVCRTFNEFVSTISTKGLPKFVSFDHDLGPLSYVEYLKAINTGKINYEDLPEKTGLDCAKWLVEYCDNNSLDFPDYEVHSMNPYGKENIISYISSFKNARQKNN